MEDLPDLCNTMFPWHLFHVPMALMEVVRNVKLSLDSNTLTTFFPVDGQLAQVAGQAMQKVKESHQNWAHVYEG